MPNVVSDQFASYELRLLYKTSTGDVSKAENEVVAGEEVLQGGAKLKQLCRIQEAGGEKLVVYPRSRNSCAPMGVP